MPNVLSPRQDGVVDHYELVAREGTAHILPGVDTPIWGYNGVFPGPTIVSRRGRTVVVQTRNDLAVPIATHLHGGVTPEKDDGYPTDLILPPAWNATSTHHGSHHVGTADSTVGGRTYTYPLDQRATTLWYHDHRMDFTAPQVWKGLLGTHIHHDDEEEALGLPAGERDLSLLICDRSFGADGTLLYPSIDPTLTGEPGPIEDFSAGVLGDVMVVNGVAWPAHRVAGSVYRLRLINTSNARHYRFDLDPAPPGPPFTQIGSDGGLLSAPVPLDTIDSSPAERFDVLVDFGQYAPGTRVVLRNRLATGDLRAVMAFDVGARDSRSVVVPPRLSAFEALDPALVVRTREFRFARDPGATEFPWQIAGHAFDPDAIAAEVTPGELEAWTFTTDQNHPVHLHLAYFQVHRRGSTGREPGDSGWKDTVAIGPDSSVTVLVRFPAMPGKYLLHCHNLEHEDMGMMANVLVR
jgi:spore coat protein A